MSEERAFGLTSAADFTLLHCSKLMTWEGARTTWVGRPGRGSENSSVRYVCKACQATLYLELVEPC